LTYPLAEIHTMFTSLLITALIAVQPDPAPMSPVEVLQIVRFNAAATDDAILHRVVELTGDVTEIYRDGIGGYVVRLDSVVKEPHRTGRIEIHCHFAGISRGDLAKIKPRMPVTLRGIPRTTKDHLHWPVDPNVRLDVKDCTLGAIAELPPPPPAAVETSN
jgi:hypothetical protein